MVLTLSLKSGYFHPHLAAVSFHGLIFLKGLFFLAHHHMPNLWNGAWHPAGSERLFGGPMLGDY